MLPQQTYGLVLFEHATGDAEAVRLLRRNSPMPAVPVPFVLLTEHADEKTVAEIIEAGTWNCVAKSQLDGATLVRTIRNTLACILCNRSNRLLKSPCASCRGRSSSRPTR